MDINSLGEYGIAALAIGALGYAIGLFVNLVARQIKDNTDRERDGDLRELLEEIISSNNNSELRKLVEENIKVQTRLVVLIEQQGESLRQIMDRMNTLWEKILQSNNAA
jgi:predicted RNA-binding protein